MIFGIFFIIFYIYILFSILFLTLCSCSPNLRKTKLPAGIFSLMIILCIFIGITVYTREKNATYEDVVVSEQKIVSVDGNYLTQSEHEHEAHVITESGNKIKMQSFEVSYGEEAIVKKVSRTYRWQCIFPFTEKEIMYVVSLPIRETSSH